jgi:glycosyltransferase involved in cell wall biosynthesis
VLMGKLLISVLIPTYNRAEYVIKGIDSVLAQSFKQYEIIVVDDGSTDNTARELIPYGDRVKYIYQRHKGKSAALNRGWREAEGEWIAFLDSDDLWMPEKLEWQVKAVERYGDEAGVFFTNGQFVGDPSLSATIFERAGKNFREVMGVIDDPVDYVLSPLHGIYEQTMLVRKNVMPQIDVFDEEIIVGEDTDFIFRLSMRTKFCFINIPLAKIDRSLQRAGLIEIYIRKPYFALQERQYIYEKWLKCIEQEQMRHKHKIRRRLRDTIYEQFKWCVLHGEIRDALNASWKLAGLTIGHLLEEGKIQKYR